MVVPVDLPIDENVINIYKISDKFLEIFNYSCTSDCGIVASILTKEGITKEHTRIVKTSHSALLVEYVREDRGKLLRDTEHAQYHA